TLEIMADLALHPAFPAEEIERQRASRLGQLVQQRENAGALASVVMASALYGSHHQYGLNELGTDTSVKAMTRDDLQMFWKQNFVPNNAALVVAGNISMSELKALAEKIFGSWTRGQTARSTLASPEPAGERVIIVDKPGAPQTQLRVLALGVPRSSPDFRAIQVMNNGLGGLFLSR